MTARPPPSAPWPDLSSAPSAPSAPSGLSPAVPERNVALVDLLDRLLAGGVVIAGEITLSIADVDLVRISLRAMIASVRAALQPDAPGAEDGEPT
ncbi:gas vesicle protein [Kitasatospora sp. NPDC093550]|uniref:gas vesicle protein n=1 Tax=Kitasatospora sp. NPDC093550 TaxID=3364089 RepID=UPI0038124FD7